MRKSRDVMIDFMLSLKNGKYDRNEVIEKGFPLTEENVKIELEKFKNILTNPVVSEAISDKPKVLLKKNSE